MVKIHYVLDAKNKVFEDPGYKKGAGCICTLFYNKNIKLEIRRLRHQDCSSWAWNTIALLLDSLLVLVRLVPRPRRRC